MDAPLKLFHLLLLLSLSSILSTPSASSTAAFVTDTSALASSPSSSTGGHSSLPTPPPPPEAITSAFPDLRFDVVRLQHPDPNLIGAFDFTNTSVVLAIPNGLIAPMASSRTLAVEWLRVHVLPFYPRSKIAVISVGEDAVAVSQISFLLPAIRNVHVALRDDIGIRSISVSTTFSFINIVTAVRPPSAATFQEPIGGAVIRPLLKFLEDTNSSFLVNLYPHNMYGLSYQISPGVALFHEGASNFSTGVRNGNPFEMMVDAVVTSLEVAGHGNIPLIVFVAETGEGTPLRKEGVAPAYIYELVEAVSKQQLQLQQGEHNWGILYPSMSKKHEPDSSIASKNTVISFGVLVCVFFFSLLLLHPPRTTLSARALAESIFALVLSVIGFLYTPEQEQEGRRNMGREIRHRGPRRNRGRQVHRRGPKPFWIFVALVVTALFVGGLLAILI
ncbi:unnamed protein product [Linum trigynum]|uniref:glucan endo-1,3-beta-D-glucosidase n=1 Tax=Linum trigynum TaxID=586398 RepID=A0AAV2DL98_9ROSI